MSDFNEALDFLDDPADFNESLGFLDEPADFNEALDFLDEPQDFNESVDFLDELADFNETVKDFCNEPEYFDETLNFEDRPEDVYDNEDFLETFTEFDELTDCAEKISNKIWQEMEKNDQETREKIPKVIAIQKKILLMALNKISDEKLSDEDENILKSFSPQAFFSRAIRRLFKPKSLEWDDSISKKKVDNILKNNSEFDLCKYLECAKIVFLLYSGKIDETSTAYVAMEYILTHGRQFGNTTKRIYQVDVNKTFVQQSKVMDDKLTSQELPTNKLLNKIGRLIQELTTAYDENKYVTLNVNTTYFTLLMLRRIVKSEAEFLNVFKSIQTHDNYVKLCPLPLNNQLPKCELKIVQKQLVNCAYLAIEAYMTTKDDLTKRILRATSILHMEWNGLQLPQLFFKVVNLYKVKVEDLYDLLFHKDCSYPDLATLFFLVNHYCNAKEKLKTGLTNLWFPYCRVLDGSYHLYLSAKENEQICVILALLVDLKLGFDRSTVRKSHWAKSCFSLKNMQTAKMMYEKLNKSK